MAMTSKERQAKIRMDAKGKIPESKLVSRWTNVGDTNMGNSSLEDIKSVLEEPNGGSLARAIMRSGAIEAACFPPALPCPEMIIECVKKYDVDTRQITAKDGTILAYLQKEAVEETFNIPTRERMISISIQQGQLDSIFTLAYRLGENKSWINDWEKTLGVYESDVAVAEGSINAATSVPMEEIVQIVSRFIVSHSTTT